MYNMKKLTKEIFVERSNAKHNNFYKYPNIYINNKIKIKIMCPIHGEFHQLPSDHLRGIGCPKCAIEKNSNNKRNNLNTIIKKCNLLYNNKYDYSLIIDYKNMNQIQVIICKIHGIFKTSLHSHLNKKRGCKFCAINKRKDNNLKFIEKSNITHNNMYNYSLVDYKNSKSKVKIICRVHGLFEQKPNDHLQGKGCPICKLSKGEKEIKNILDTKGIEYEQQKTFKGCKYKKLLKFDFYLPDYNLCIEYNGEQHYKPFEYYGGDDNFKNTQQRDMIKEKYCNDNNIELLKIKYDENILKILEQII